MKKPINLIAFLLLLSVIAGCRNEKQQADASTAATDSIYAEYRRNPIAKHEIVLDTAVTNDVSKRIRQFFSLYFSSIDGNKHEAEYLIPELQDKCARVISATGINIYCRAQDYDEKEIERTLECRHLDSCWYEVSFKRMANDTIERIPVRIVSNEREARIGYIVPIWGGKEYGDSLFRVNDAKVSMADGQEFVSSFYKHYAYIYSFLSTDLDKKLAALRKLYLTDNMLQKYADTLAEYEGTLEEGYDAVIGNCDFDIFWYRSINVEPVADKQYRLTYGYGDWQYQCLITIEGEEGNYKITNVEEI